MSVYAMEDGAGQEMQESISGNDDTGDVWEEPEEAEQESVDRDAEPEEPAEPIDRNKEEDEQENREAEDEAVETEQEDLEDPDETETVSENTVDEEPKGKEILIRNLSFPQVYATGRSFTVDGKSYNSMDADETYSAGDDIMAYFFAGDSLLYFDGTGPMKDWSTLVTRPWNNIKPAVCVIGEGITTVGANAFNWPTHSIKSVHLPDTLQVINNYAFHQNSDVETLILPDGLERIGERAFLGCHALTSIDIPESVTDLGKTAFYECRSAASIYVPGSIREIKKMTFSGCKAAVDVAISEGVEIIGEGAFQNIVARSVVLPEGVKQIGDYAFNNAAKLTSIGKNAFVVGSEKKFILESENETACACDWTGDNRVIAYQIMFMDRDS